MTDFYDFNDRDSVASYEDDRISIGSDLPPSSPLHRPLSGISTRRSFSRSGSLRKRSRSSRSSRRASYGSVSVNGGDAEGLGSLADELAGALGDDYDEEGEYEEGEEGGFGEASGEGLVIEPEEVELPHNVNEQVIQNVVVSGETEGSKSTDRATPDKTSLLNRSRLPKDYNGSSYDGPEDLKDGVSPALQVRLEQIERLATAGKKSLKTAAITTLEVWNEDGGGIITDDQDINDVIPRVVEGLQNLQPQSILETGCTRLTTAHAALSLHMYNQTRTLRDLSFSLLSSAVPAPDDTTDLLLAVISLIPQSTYDSLTELSSLHNLTADLISQLSLLSDSLNMARQSSIVANRKLRSTKEACSEWKNELEEVERSRRLIEEGCWEERCRSREAGKICGEVIEGFKEACSRYEEKIQAMLVAC